MLTCALCVVPVVAAPRVSGEFMLPGGLAIDAKWIAVLLIGLAAAAHQGFSANLFTLTSDMFRVMRWARSSGSAASPVRWAGI